jgi:hypothetical protein
MLALTRGFLLVVEPGRGSVLSRGILCSPWCRQAATGMTGWLPAEGITCDGILASSYG